MAYLSCIELKPASRELSSLAQLALGDPYREHQLVWRFFPHLEGQRGRRPQARPGALRGEAPFIYRREGRGNQCRFYVVSETLPQADPLLWRCESKPYAPQLAVADRLAFSVRVNPTRVFGGKRHDLVVHRKKQLEVEHGGRWHDHTSQADILMQVAQAWLAGRSERYGYALDAKTLIVEGYQRLAFQGREGDIVLGALDLRGELSVTDPVILREGLLGGVGRAQGFGMGLMLVRRVG